MKSILSFVQIKQNTPLKLLNKLFKKQESFTTYNLVSQSLRGNYDMCCKYFNKVEDCSTNPQILQVS